MRRKFSERYGYKNPREVLQVESLNEALKNRLWNNIKMAYIDPLSTSPYVGEDWNISNNEEIFNVKRLYDSFF